MLQHPRRVLLAARLDLQGHLHLVEVEVRRRAPVHDVQDVGARVLLAGMLIPPNYGPRYTSAFAASYTELAERFDLPLVPFLLDGVAGKRALTQEDGLHPTAAAQEKILDNVWETLQPLLKQS